MGSLAGEKVLIGPSSFAAMDPSPMDMLVKAGAEVVDNPYKRRLTKDELRALLTEGITGLIAGLEPLDRDVLSSSGLKVISRCGSGMSNVDTKAADELGILVRYTPDAPVESVAELALGAMLSLLRMVPLMDSQLHEGKWTKKIGTLLEGKTVAIIGFGRIGRRLSELLAPFNAKVLAVDPFLDGGVDEYDIVSLNAALPQADIISIHSSGEACVLGQEEFDMMKRGAFLLNVARGSLVEENALVKALDEGRIAGAYLDVFWQEPYTGPLVKYPQVILTPHVGSYTKECRKRMETEAADNLIEAFGKIKGGQI